MNKLLSAALLLTSLVYLQTEDKGTTGTHAGALKVFFNVAN